MWDICEKTQEYQAMLQAKLTYTVEINISCVLFKEGIYDVKKAINRIVKAMNKMKKQYEVNENTPQYKAYQTYLQSFYNKTQKYRFYEQYFGIVEYEKELESCKKALEPLEKRFCSSLEIKELIAESIAESFPIVSTTDKNCSFSNKWCWDKEKEDMLLLHIVNKNIAK